MILEISFRVKFITNFQTVDDYLGHSLKLQLLRWEMNNCCKIHLSYFRYDLQSLSYKIK